MNDDNYLSSLSISQMATLLQMNANPTLLNTSVKVSFIGIILFLGNYSIRSQTRWLYLLVSIPRGLIRLVALIYLDKQRHSSDYLWFWSLALGSTRLTPAQIRAIHSVKDQRFHRRLTKSDHDVLCAFAKWNRTLPEETFCWAYRQTRQGLF